MNQSPGEMSQGAGVGGRDKGGQCWLAVLATVHRDPSLLQSILERPSPCHVLGHCLVSSSGACGLPAQNVSPLEGRAGFLFFSALNSVHMRHPVEIC